MANIAAYMMKAGLDWMLGGAAVTQPATRALGLSLGVPSSVSQSEMNTGLGYTRQAAAFAAAASPAGSASNNAAVTFGPFNTAMTIVGISLWDTVLTLNSGNALWYGTLTASRAVSSGDSLVIAAGALVITLA